MGLTQKLWVVIPLCALVSGCLSDDDSDESVAPLNNGEVWAEVSRMDPERFRAASCSGGGSVYFFGGAGELENLAQKYDPALNQWSTIDDVPQGRRSGAACAFLDGKIYLMGGYSLESGNPLPLEVDVYDTETGSWSQAAPMITNRMDGVATTLGGKIYMIGGTVSSGSNTTLVEMYDPVSDTWVKKAPFPVNFHRAAAATVNDRLFVFGGLHIVGHPDEMNFVTLGSVYEYDASIDLWSIRADIPTERHSHSATAVDGKVYVIGGVNGFGLSHRVVEEYDPQTNSWATKTPLPQGRRSHGAGMANDVIYIFGGVEYDQSPSISHYDVLAYAPSNE